MKDVRIGFKFRNNFIITKMKNRGIRSVAELCRLMNESLAEGESKAYQSVLGKLISMKMPSKKSDGSWITQAMNLATFFQCLPEDLFSTPQQLNSLKTNRAEAQRSFMEIQQLTLNHTDCPEVRLQAMNFASCLREGLLKLTPKQQVVIRKRFGIDCEEQTLEEIAVEFKVGRERIRQIEAKALRKLKHPSNFRAIAATVCSSTIVKTNWGPVVEYTIDQTVLDALLDI